MLDKNLGSHSWILTFPTFLKFNPAANTINYTFKIKLEILFSPSPFSPLLSKTPFISHMGSFIFLRRVLLIYYHSPDDLWSLPPPISKTMKSMGKHTTHITAFTFTSGSKENWISKLLASINYKTSHCWEILATTRNSRYLISKSISSQQLDIRYRSIIFSASSLLYIWTVNFGRHGYHFWVI